VETQTTTTAEGGIKAVNQEGQATSGQGAPQTEPVIVQDGVVQPAAVQEPTEGTPEWATKRFGELTAQREDAKREAENARRDAEFYKQVALERASAAPQPAATAAPTTVEPQGPPSLESFTDYTDYMKALADYQVKEAVKAVQAQSQQATTQQDRQTKFKTAADEFKKTTPDFEAVITSPSFRQTAAVIEAIYYSTKGPQLAYYLAKNPDVTNRLNTLSPFEVALEVGRLEERLTPPQPKVISSTPAPLQNLSGTNATPEKDLATIASKGTMDDYAAARAPALQWKGRRAR
jgi:hypothetical protein